MIYNFSKNDFDYALNEFVECKKFFANFYTTRNDYAIQMASKPYNNDTSVLKIIDIRTLSENGNYDYNYIWKVFDLTLKELALREDFK